MVKIIDGVKQGFGFVFVLSIFVFGFYLVKGWNGLQATDGDPLGATQWNQLVNKVDTLEGQVSNTSSAPSGAVMAFNLTTCPAGRKPADGTNGTPDLRGKFLRGLNSFDGGTSIVNLNEGDQDGVSRTLGSYQGDQYKSHKHPISTANNDVNTTSSQGYPFGDNHTAFRTTDRNQRVDTGNESQLVNNTGGTETRPKNIAVIFCIKE